MGERDFSRREINITVLFFTHPSSFVEKIFPSSENADEKLCAYRNDGFCHNQAPFNYCFQNPLESNNPEGKALPHMPFHRN
jgi:hypothetical protein